MRLQNKNLPKGVQRSQRNKEIKKVNKVKEPTKNRNGKEGINI